MFTPWKKSYDQPRQHIKKQRHYFANKGPSSQGLVFPVVMYGCESWTIKKAECQRTDAFILRCLRRVLRVLRVPWTAKRSVNPKGNQPWIFIGRTDAEAEALLLLPPDVRSWFTGKDSDAGRAWGQEDEMVRWHHQLNGQKFQEAPGVDGQGSLVCCSPWGCKESDTIEQMNWTEWWRK